MTLYYVPIRVITGDGDALILGSDGNRAASINGLSARRRDVERVGSRYLFYSEQLCYSDGRWERQSHVAA